MRPMDHAAAVIRQVILDGDFAPLDPLPSYREISQRYALSLASVVGGMELLEQEGLVSRQHRRGTFVRPEMQQKSASRWPLRLRCINFISRTGDIPLDQMRHEYLAGYTDALERHDIRMRFVASAREDEDIVDRLALDGVPLQSQGCVFIAEPSHALCRSLLRHGIHYVLQQQPAPIARTLPQGHCVHVNKYAGAFAGTEYVLKLGHRRIGCVGRNLSQIPGLSCSLFDGYCAALARAGLMFLPDDILEIPAEHPSVAFGPAREYLRRADRPTALITTNDAIALGVLNAALSLGIRVPEELSIVGYNDEPAAANAPAPLTTLTNPRRLMARTAVELLIEVCEGKYHTTQTRALDSHLVVRDSTAPPPAA